MLLYKRNQIYGSIHMLAMNNSNKDVQSLKISGLYIQLTSLHLRPQSHHQPPQHLHSLQTQPHSYAIQEEKAMASLSTSFQHMDLQIAGTYIH